MIPFFVDSNGVPMGKNIPAPSPEVGTDTAPSMIDLVKAAEDSARKQSTVQEK